jgi:protein-S-isoprenylcysteine O-methyltransferase Ste14
MTAPIPKSQSSLVAAAATRLLTVLITFALMGVILFAAAGRLDWTWAWVFLGINLAVVLFNSVFMLRNGLETIAERGRPREFKDWDKAVSGVWGVIQYLALPLVAGLDARFGWTAGLAPAWNIAGGAVFTAGILLFSWAMITNAYFSTTARIQSDRGQTVCRSGPYRIVRHPAYVGAILQSPGTSILLGSGWSLIPAAGAAVCIIIRTALEDRMLREELAGYADYVKEVKYRLVPGIW